MPPSNQILNDGRYRITQQIPLNGQTAVFEAYDTVNESNVIVKEINLPLGKVAPPAQQDQIQKAFADQAKTLTLIKHEALHHVSDFFSDVGRQYLVLESLDGDHLGDALETAGVGFAMADVLKWADQLLDAIQYLHNFVPPIIHRNIRPRNIKLTSDNRIKLLAFGMTDPAGNGVNTNISGQMLETEISYSPLEQIWADLDPASQKVISNSFSDRDSKALTEALTPGADIYSLGATLYHLLTGRKPVDALERVIEILEGKSDPLKPVSELAPDIPPEICDVIRRSMEIKLSERFDSAAIMRQVLKTAQVRAKEREEEEEREMAEAAEVLREAELLKQKEVKELLARKQAEAEEEQRRHASELAAKLREAEEQRVAAERRAAEMERLLQEKEANADALPASDDLLLDIEPLHISNPSSIPDEHHSREVILSEIVDDLASGDPQSEDSFFSEKTEPEPIYQTPFEAEAENEDVQEPLVAASLPPTEDVGVALESTEPDDKPLEVASDVESVVMSEIEPEPLAVVDEPSVDFVPASTWIETSDEVLEPGPYPIRSIPMSTIAGGVGLLLCFVVLGAWYFMGSTSAVETPPQVPAAVLIDERPASSREQETLPAGADESLNEDTADKTETENMAESLDSPQTARPAESKPLAVKPTPQRTPQVRDATPKPTPERRRAVTVDDLINDN